MRTIRSNPAAAVGLALLLAPIGCSTMRGGGNGAHPGVVEANPKAVNRVYHASATRTAWALTKVMQDDSILDDVRLMIDPQSSDSRPFAREEREKLAIPSTKVAARDVNYNIQAKSKDGHRVGAVIQLKGDAEAEVSLLYGVAGDPELSRALLDGVDRALEGPATKPALWEPSESPKTARKAPTS